MSRTGGDFGPLYRGTTIISSLSSDLVKLKSASLGFRLGLIITEGISLIPPDLWRSAGHAWQGFGISNSTNPAAV